MAETPRKFACPQTPCKSSFTTQFNLNRHLKNVHKVSEQLGSSSLDKTSDLVICLRRESFEFTLENAPHLCIQFDPSADLILRSAWFPTDDDLKPFQNFYERRENQLVLHQSLVTAFHIRHLSTKGDKFTVSIREWHPDVFNEFPDNDSTTTFLFLDTTDGDPREAPKPWLQAAEMRDRQLNLYPSQREMEMEQGKLEFVKTLDSIAKSAEEKFRFRPVTCFGEGICPLLGHTKTVYKRSWSASSTHVIISEERLPCVPCLPFGPKRMTKKRKRGENGEQGNVAGMRWLHQEYLPLVARGEFRVFVAPGEDLKGRVFHWVHTAVNRDNKDVKDLVLVTKPLGNDSQEF